MDEDELAEVGLTVSASERKKMAKSGAAMPGGHFPIHDLDHLASAKAFYHQGKHAGQDPEEIRAHINRRAKALGGTGLDEDEDDHESEHQGNEGPKPRPGRRHTRPVQVRRRGQTPFGGEGGSPDGGSGASGTGDSGSMAASAPRRALVRAGRGYETVALSEDEEWAEAEIARLTAEHPTVGLASMRDAKNYGTVVIDGQGVTPNVNKHFDFQVYDVGARDDGDPSDPGGADTASVIARLQANHPEFFQEKPYGANRRGKLAGKYPGTGPSGKPQTVGR
jgi:hypothetical protein